MRGAGAGVIRTHSLVRASYFAAEERPVGTTHPEEAAE